MKSIPHEPNIIDQEKKEVYSNLSKVVNDACEVWLRRKGLGTQNYREQMNTDYRKAKAKSKLDYDKE